MKKSNEEFVRRYALEPKDNGFIIPVVISGDTYTCVSHGGRIELTCFPDEGESYEVMFHEFPGVDKVRVVASAGTGFIIAISPREVYHLNKDGDLVIVNEDKDKEPGVTSYAGDIICNETSLNILPSTKIKVCKSSAFLTYICCAYDEDNGVALIQPHVIPVENHAGKNFIGCLHKVNHGADWTVFMEDNGDQLGNKGIAYILYKSKLTRLPVDCVDVMPAVDGCEFIRHSHSLGYISSYVSNLDIGNVIRGGSERFREVISKDKTQLVGYRGNAAYMFAENESVSKGILLDNGLYCSSPEGLNRIVNPLGKSTISVVHSNRIDVFTTG